MTFATVAAVVFLSGCNQPIADAAKLEAIRAEAHGLMDTHPPEPSRKSRKVAEKQWPTAIASLHPEDVTVHTWGVDIVTKASADGGYGYEVPRGNANLPLPATCYSEPSQGVFWHGPC